MEQLKLTHVYKTYQRGDSEVQALADVSMCVSAGEFVAIIGQSGSGKSTLMNLLGCLDVPTSGEYWLEGRNVATLSDKALSLIRNRRLGFVFQNFQLIPGLDAVENVELPLMYRGVPQDQRRELATAYLKRVGLGDRLRHTPAELSGGQQQRVALARAMAAGPPILLADEPTGNLDPASGRDVLELLREFHQEGHTVLLITHDERIAAAAERRVRLQSGRLQEE